MAAARRTDVVVVGGGHSGLSMSKQLADRAVDHVVLEQGEVADSWRQQRWNSFTLLTPNWQTRLPGAAYDGDDPDGFMTGTEIVEFIEGYADDDRRTRRVRDGGRPSSPARRRLFGRDRRTAPGAAAAVVIAGGACNVPTTPDFAAAVPPDIVQVNPLEYRSPEQLPEGGVLVVGAAATGIQLAEEIHAVGPTGHDLGGRARPDAADVPGPRHPALDGGDRAARRALRRGRGDPQGARGRVASARRHPGPPDARPQPADRCGVQLRGRLGAIRDGVALFSGGLRNHCALADQKLGRLLDDIDEWIDDGWLERRSVEPAERFEPTRVPRATRSRST